MPRSTRWTPRASPTDSAPAREAEFHELIEGFGLPCPNYIKIDVPGMTEPILAGAERTLQRPEVREIHVELREHSAFGQRVIDTLGRHGFAPRTRDTHAGTTDVTFARTR